MGWVVLLGVLNYFLRRSLALNLSRTDFGFIYATLAIVMLVLAFLDFGLGESLTILMSRSIAESSPQRTRQIFVCSFFFRAVMAVVCFGALAVFAPWVRDVFLEYPGPLVYVLGLFFLIIMLSLESAIISALDAMQAFGVKYAIMNGKAALLCVGATLFVPRFGVGFIIVLWPIVSLLAATAGYAYLHWGGKVRLGRFGAEHVGMLKHVLSISVWIAVAGAGTAMMHHMDKLCLTWFTDLEVVGTYEVALSLMQIAYSLMLLPIIFTPIVSQLWVHKEYRQIRRHSLRIILFSLALLPVAVLVGIFFARDIIVFMFADEFSEGAAALAWLWSGAILLSVGRLCTRTLNSGHLHRSTAAIVVACVVVNFVLNVVLIPPLGMTGAAMATAISYFVLAAASFVRLFTYLARKIRQEPVPLM